MTTTKRPRKRSTTPGGLRGPKRLYRHVVPTPVTMKLTAEGIDIMDKTQKRAGVSRGVLFDYMLRKFAKQVPANLMATEPIEE